MSIIAVKGIPQKWSLTNVVKVLAKSIGGHFEALNFQLVGKHKGGKVKVCYLRLSEKLDPVRVVERINSTTFKIQLFRPFAYIPDHVPDLPLASKPKKVNYKLRRHLRLEEDHSPDEVLVLTTQELIIELQSKFPRLYKLSKKTEHKLLDELAKKVFARLKTVGERDGEALGSCFKLSQSYRRAHAHSGDLQLVLNTLHALRDAPDTLDEKELTDMPPHMHMIDNLPYDKVQEACNKYSERIINKISEHVNNLKSDVTETDTEDEIVRKKVREELKKMGPFLPQIVKQVVSKHFLPQKMPFYRIRIYGEPFLPSKETMVPFVARYHSMRTSRSERIFNLIRFNVPPSHYASLMAMDGTVLNGAKLVIRSSNMLPYKVPAAVLAGNSGEQTEIAEEMEEDWDEPMDG